LYAAPLPLHRVASGFSRKALVRSPEFNFKCDILSSFLNGDTIGPRAVTAVRRRVVRLGQPGGYLMRRTQLLCAVGVSLWSAAVDGHQVVSQKALSEALRAHVKDEHDADPVNMGESR
jgi:hypothetical protein